MLCPDQFPKIHKNKGNKCYCNLTSKIMEPNCNPKIGTHWNKKEPSILKYWSWPM